MTTIVQSTVTLKPLPFRFDKRRDGWKLMEDAGLGKGEFKLKLGEFFHGEDYVVGHTMLEREKAAGDRAGQQHAERLMDQWDDIPVDWPEFLVFTGTVWRIRSLLCVPVLRREYCRELGFVALDDNFNRRYGSVRLCK